MSQLGSICSNSTGHKKKKPLSRAKERKLKEETSPSAAKSKPDTLQPKSQNFCN